MRLKVLVFILSVVFVGCAFADNFDVTEEIIRVDKAKIDTIALMPEESFAVVQIFKGYEVEIEGQINFIPTKTIRLEFRNKEDDPETEEIDETDTSYTDLLNAITINKQALRTLIKSKL